MSEEVIEYVLHMGFDSLNVEHGFLNVVETSPVH